MTIFDFPFVLAFVLAGRIEMMSPQFIAAYHTEKECTEAAVKRNSDATIKTDGARSVGASFLCYSLVGSI